MPAEVETDVSVNVSAGNCSSHSSDVNCSSLSGASNSAVDEPAMIK